MLTAAGYPASATSNRAGESSADVRSDSRTSLASTVILHSTTSFLTEHPTSAACQINRRAGLIQAEQRPLGTAAILAFCCNQARGVFEVRAKVTPVVGLIKCLWRPRPANASTAEFADADTTLFLAGTNLRASSWPDDEAK